MDQILVSGWPWLKKQLTKNWIPDKWNLLRKLLIHISNHRIARSLIEAPMTKELKRVTAKTIAGWFINATDRESGEVMTHLKLQKLVYYAQAWYLANFDRPLFAEDMQAWTHGPVTPTVYEKYRHAGFEALPPQPTVRLSNDLDVFLKAIYAEYGKYTAKHLEKMTHDEDPWQITRQGLPLEARCTTPIDKLLIRNFYAERLGKKEITQLSD